MNKFKGEKILVVDDEPGITMSISLWLQTLGAETFTANCGKDAFSLVIKNAIDLVISDVRMPNGNGLELLDDIRKFNPKIPSVLLATGFSEITQEQAQQRGAEALLFKPLDFDKLHDKIISILSKHKKEEYSS